MKLMDHKKLTGVATELVVMVGTHTEHAVLDWLDQACPNPMDRRRLMLLVASMVPADMAYDGLVRERFAPTGSKKR